MLAQAVDFGFPVFSRRAYVPHHRKLREMPAIAAAFVSLYLPDAPAPGAPRE